MHATMSCRLSVVLSLSVAVSLSVVALVRHAKENGLSDRFMIPTLGVTTDKAKPGSGGSPDLKVTTFQTVSPKMFYWA